MKEPVFGFNKEQSFIEFSTTEGIFRLGKEDSKLFLELNGTKIYLTADDGTLNTDATELGADATPVVRTNNPIVGTNKPNVNIDLLDAAIGADITPVTRTAGQLAVANNVNQNIDALDSAIGFEAQMSGTPNLVTKTGTVFQMLDQLDAKKTSQTVKKTIGWDGAAGTDFVFAGDANHTAQNIDLGAIVPAKARVTGIEIVCIEAAVGVTDITFRAGNASGGEQFIESISCDDLNEVAGIIHAEHTAVVVMNWASATNIWIGADPTDATWGDMTAGKWAVYVTFTYLNNI